jgi:hypothetical protein
LAFCRELRQFLKTRELQSFHLIDELEHGALDFVVAAGTVVEPGTADGVDFVEEDLDKSFHNISSLKGCDFWHLGVSFAP